MVLELPAADKTPLKSAPLELVVCQIRYDESVRVADGKVILALYAALGGKDGPLARLQQAQVQTAEITVGPQGPLAPQRLSTQRGWQLLSNDGTLVASIMPDTCTLQATKFNSWHEDFGPLLTNLLTAIEEHVAPAMEQRLGIRYVDRLTSPTLRQSQDWAGVIRPTFLGPILHPLLGPHMASTLQQVDLDAGEGVRCVVKHGVLPDPTTPPGTNYVIDTDVFHEPARAFTSATIAQDAERFHELAVRVFQQVITAEYLTHLQQVGA